MAWQAGLTAGGLHWWTARRVLEEAGLIVAGAWSPPRSGHSSPFLFDLASSPLASQSSTARWTV